MDSASMLNKQYSWKDMVVYQFGTIDGIHCFVSQLSSLCYPVGELPLAVVDGFLTSRLNVEIMFEDVSLLKA